MDDGAIGRIRIGDRHPVAHRRALRPGQIVAQPAAQLAEPAAAAEQLVAARALPGDAGRDEVGAIEQRALRGEERAEAQGFQRVERTGIERVERIERAQDMAPA